MSLREVDRKVKALISADPFNVAEYERLRSSLRKLKKKVAAAGDELSAKKCWVYEQITQLHKTWVEVFQQLKNGSFYHAWCGLEKCELTIRFMQSHLSTIGGNGFGVKWIENAVRRFQSLYPYGAFFSPGIIELEKKCNICDRKVTLRDHCGHEVGEIYGGEMCHRIITKAEFLEISIVQQPMQKYSVAFLSDEKTGQSRDHYDYAVVRYAVSGLTNRFTPWSAKFTKRRYPIARFAHVDPEGRCPCGSQAKFRDCCAGKSEIDMPHIEFTFAAEPQNIPREVLVLGSARKRADQSLRGASKKKKVRRKK